MSDQRNRGRRTKRLFLGAAAAAALAAPAAANAVTVYTHHPRLEPAARVIPGSDTYLANAAPLEVWCWNQEAWAAAPYADHDGFYDGFANLKAWKLCRPLERAVAGWKPHLPDRRYHLGYAAFILAHEAAHSAGADHDNTDGTPSADCIAAANIRRVLRRLGQGRYQARAIERELIGSFLGYQPAETERCWQPLQP